MIIQDKPTTHERKFFDKILYVTTEEFRQINLTLEGLKMGTLKMNDQTCSACGHLILNERCEIHNCSPITKETSSCGAWQGIEDKTDLRCENCKCFKLSTPAQTWGDCTEGHYKNPFGLKNNECHKLSFACRNLKRIEVIYDE